MTRTRTVIAAGLLVPVLALGGCTGDDPQPKIADPTPSGTNSSSTPASEPRVEQAQLLRDFISGVSSALRTGDPAAFLSLSSSDCINCQVLSRNLRGAYENGGHIEGGRWEVVSSAFQRNAPLGAIWTVQVRSSRERWFNGDDELVKVVRPGIQHFGVAIEPAGAAWRVRELKLSRS